MPSIVMKHTATDAHNCEIEWNADFGKMKLTLQAGFVSPRLLHDFLWQLPHQDDRFVRTGIIGAVQITGRFDTRLELPSGTVFRIRAYQPAAVAKLHGMGLRVVMLSGDNAATAQAIAAQAGIKEFRAEVLPQDKAAEVESLKESVMPAQAGIQPDKNTGFRVRPGMTNIVGMVGDGINDAPALAAADVGFAMKSGSDIALEAADLTLMRNDLASVADAVSLSHATLKKIRQNLFFAFGYNVLGIPLAAAGMLNPVIAGAAMAMSSVSVVSNALLLKRWRGSA